MHPLARSRTVALLLPTLLLALGLPSCAPESAPVTPAASGPGAEPARPSPSQSPSQPPSDDERREIADDLRALGYVDWDPGADPELVGVVRHDRARAHPGYNLYGNGVNEVHLVDMDGQRVHTWRLPANRQRTTFAELLDDDTLAVVCNYQLLTRLDWNSRILWELDLRAHHDVAQKPDGSLLVPYRQREEFRGRRVRFDGIAHVSLEGQVLSTWYTFEHLEELGKHHEPSSLDQPKREGEVEPAVMPDYHHLNTVEVLPETELGRRDARFRAGNVLVCFRNLSLIAVLDQDDYSVTWSWGTQELEGAHMPTMLSDGHILVYDNGVRRKATRILELEPVSGTIVWKYEGDPPASFYSELRGSAQRLPNGNTLICESDRGHVIEVTRAGEIVWEYWNPDITGDMRKRIYRCMRLPAERIEALLEAHAAPR